MLNMKQRNRDGQFESAGPCTARVHIEDAVPFLNRRPVRVATNNCTKAGRRRVQVKLLEIVKDIQGEVLDLDELRFAEFTGPLAFVDVSPYSNDRGDLSQICKHFRASNVSGMNDHIDAFEYLRNPRPNKAVGVRDHAHEMGIRETSKTGWLLPTRWFLTTLQ